MIKVIQAIGCMVFSILMYSIPILASCAVILDWFEPITALLIVCALVQFIALLVITAVKVGEDNEF